MKLASTVPLPTNWQHHISDFMLFTNRSSSEDLDQYERIQKIDMADGVLVNRRTGRPMPFQCFDMPFRMVYAPFPAHVIFYRGGQPEENYAAILRIVAKMMAAGVYAQAGYDRPPRMTTGLIWYSSRPHHLQELVQDRCEMGDFQLKAPPDLPDSRHARLLQFLARFGLVRVPERPPAEIILPVCSSSSDNLFEAVRQGNLDRVQGFLEAGVDIEERDELGQTALMVAASHHQVEAVKLFLEHGADVNACAASGWTALMSGAMLGNETLLTLLLANGALVDAASLTKQTALRVAAIFGHNACVRLLISKGAT